VIQPATNSSDKISDEDEEDDYDKYLDQLESQASIDVEDDDNWLIFLT